MQIHISPAGPPIYQQIVDQIRHRIVSSQLVAGDEMPAIRVLAERLQVNPNTVARAYRELENEGLVEKRRTTGTFVAQQIQRQNMAQRRQSLAPHVDNLVIQSRQLGFELADVIDQLRKRDAQLSRQVSREEKKS